ITRCQPATKSVSKRAGVGVGSLRRPYRLLDRVEQDFDVDGLADDPVRRSLPRRWPSVTAGREHEHWCGGPNIQSFEVFEELRATHYRHRQIQDDEARAHDCDSLERFSTVARAFDGVALVLQELLEDLSDVLVVVDDQDRLFRMRGLVR